ncbi:MAG: tRNA lysidine(34) synthetase TilS [Leptospiraceae bacterium]|nr:tRNA lysidine(34) synthetase TilS [Leptospiraceae bacterium]
MKDPNQVFENLISRCSKSILMLFERKAILAYSGGKDSLILLYFYKYLFENKLTQSFLIYHLVHGIRENQNEVLEIKNFIKNEFYNFEFILKQRNIPFLAKRIKKSLEETGRMFRYKDLKKISKNHNSIILTGHHTEDYLESLFINLIRGGGENSLGTLGVFQNNIFRPLLLFTKQEREFLYSYFQDKVFEDSSNLSESFLRNRIRKKITPELFREGLDIDKLYWNFHSLEDIYLNEEKILVPYQKISYLNLKIETILLKKIIDSCLISLGLHPIKKNLFLEIVDLIRNQSSFLKENSEIYFWKSTKSDLYLIPKNSKVLEKPRIKGNEIFWNHCSYILKEDEYLSSVITHKHIEVKFGTKEITEIFREFEIPSPMRMHIPIIVKNEEVSAILLSFFDKNLRDYKKNSIQ